MGLGGSREIPHLESPLERRIGMGKRNRLAAAITLVVVLAASGGCAQPAASLSMQPHPTDQQAREDLSRLVELARTSGIPQLCERGTSNCDGTAKDFAAALSVPSTAPVIVGSRDIPDSGQSQGGRALKVCGLDGTGHAYRNEILFFGTSVDFTAIEALYWVVGFQESPLVGPTDASPGPEWNPCPTGTAG